MERMPSSFRSTLRSIALKSGTALLAALTAFPPYVPAAAAAEGSPLEGWTRLRYTTAKLIVFSGELTMNRSVSGEKTIVRTDSRANLFGAPFVNTWSVSSMDRKSGRPLEFFDVRPKKKADRYTFGAGGILHETLKPRKNSPNEPMEQWRISKKQTLPVVTGAQKTSGTSADASSWVHDYISMIVRLHDLPLRKVGDEATVRVLTSKGAVPMEIRVSQERDVRRQIADLATGKKATINFHELRLRVKPLAGTASETKGFLNMEGETELWVDAATRTVTEISGEIPKVPGRVDIEIAGYKK